jgi:L-lactate dehydrogenase (cytochrome)
MRDLLQKATACRCPVLVFTVDMPQPGSRYRDVRSGLSGASGFRGALRRFGQALVRPRWCWDVGLWGRPYRLGSIAPVLGKKSGLEDFLGWMSQNFDPSITWKDLDWIRDIWKGPLVIKGVLDADDARAAADLGAEGIIVSNHGGRQLDGVVSTVKALPRIAEAVGDRLVVLADGGVRSGLDVVRLLSLGARGVCLGRAWAYGLAARGERGVREVLDIVRNEMRIAMALTGASRPSDLGAQTLEKA